MKQQSGFTLIELMIVVAVIGLLVAIALPVYQSYVIKAKVSEGLLATAQCRSTVAEVYQTMKVDDTVSANEWGCGEGATQTQYVSNIATDENGVITITLQNIADIVNNENIILTPQDTGGNALQDDDFPTQVAGFECLAGSNAIRSYLPGSCK